MIFHFFAIFYVIRVNCFLVMWLHKTLENQRNPNYKMGWIFIAHELSLHNNIYINNWKAFIFTLFQRWRTQRLSGPTTDCRVALLPSGLGPCLMITFSQILDCPLRRRRQQRKTRAARALFVASQCQSSQRRRCLQKIKANNIFKACSKCGSV